MVVAPANNLEYVVPCVPSHVAVIMDGNGRWAQARGKPRVFGHRRGARTVRQLVTRSREWGVRYLTLFAMSTENLRRPQGEVDTLFRLMQRFMADEADELCANNIRFRLMGNRSYLPPAVLEAAAEVEFATSACDAMDLTVAVAYGGREDLVAGIERLHRLGQQVTAENLAQHLWSAHLPQVDLLIRTGGERRISNFMLWHLAYAELYFSDVRWPDFDDKQYAQALRDFAQRQRRYGQVASPA
jgi:undecaprenyl diphosphate synthase